MLPSDRMITLSQLFITFMSVEKAMTDSGKHEEQTEATNLSFSLLSILSNRSLNSNSLGLEANVLANCSFLTTDLAKPLPPGNIRV